MDSSLFFSSVHFHSSQSSFWQSSFGHHPHHSFLVQTITINNISPFFSPFSFFFSSVSLRFPFSLLSHIHSSWLQNWPPLTPPSLQIDPLFSRNIPFFSSHFSLIFLTLFSLSFPTIFPPLIFIGIFIQYSLPRYSLLVTDLSFLMDNQKNDSINWPTNGNYNTVPSENGANFWGKWKYHPWKNGKNVHHRISWSICVSKERVAIFHPLYGRIVFHYSITCTANTHLSWTYG